MYKVTLVELGQQTYHRMYGVRNAGFYVFEFAGMIVYPLGGLMVAAATAANPTYLESHWWFICTGVVILCAIPIFTVGSVVTAQVKYRRAQRAIQRGERVDPGTITNSFTLAAITLSVDIERYNERAKRFLLYEELCTDEGMERSPNESIIRFALITAGTSLNGRIDRMERRVTRTKRFPGHEELTEPMSDPTEFWDVTDNLRALDEQIRSLPTRRAQLTNG